MTPPRHTYRADAFGLSKEALNLNQAEAAAPELPSTVADPFTSSSRLRRRLGLALAASACVLALAPAAASATIAPAPGWHIESVAAPTNFAPGDTSGHDLYVVTATNSGALEASGSGAVISDTLPAGLTPTEVEFFIQPFAEGIGATNLGTASPYQVCTIAPLKCEYPGPLARWIWNRARASAEPEIRDGRSR